MSLLVHCSMVLMECSNLFINNLFFMYYGEILFNHCICYFAVWYWLFGYLVNWYIQLDSVWSISSWLLILVLKLEGLHISKKNIWLYKNIFFPKTVNIYCILNILFDTLLFCFRYLCGFIPFLFGRSIMQVDNICTY